MAAKKKSSRSSAQTSSKRRKSAGRTAATRGAGARKSTNGAKRLTPSAQKAVDDVREQAQAYMQPKLKKLVSWAREAL